jgi:hypothetical protein
MEYLGAWGTLIHEKNLKSKISCQTPVKEKKEIAAAKLGSAAEHSTRDILACGHSRCYTYSIYQNLGTHKE